MFRRSAQQGTTTHTLTLPNGNQRANRRNIQQNLFRHPHLTFGGGLIQQGEIDTVVRADGTTVKTREMAIQTDYRDSEAQTDPYTPPSIIPPGQPDPDIVALISFTYGHGLPAGAFEVAQIEKAQERREKEARLPTGSDPRAFKARVKHFAQCDLDDWMEREEEVKAAHERRINALRTALASREQARENVMKERLMKIKEEKEATKDVSVHTIERERVKNLRHFAIEAREPEGRQRKKRDRVEEYHNFESKVYAPLPRDGLVGERAVARVTVRNVYNETFEGLEILERDLPLSVLTRPVRLPSKPKPKTMAERQQLKIDGHIREMEAALRAQKRPGTAASTGSVEREGEKKKKTKHIPVRPPTPTVEMEGEGGEGAATDDERYGAALLLQRLLRGRAVQTMMLEGKMKRADLIRELRLEEDLRQRKEQAEFDMAGLDEDAKAELAEAQEKAARAIVSGAVGEVIGATLDTLSAELVRVREERRVAAMVQLAERSRRLREAAESGRRQEEEEKRAREDERMRQVMHTQHRTVDAFLESIIADSCDAAAKKNAVMEARVLAGRLGDVLYQVEQRDPEKVVKDLVTSFLFPEVEHGLLREQVKRDQRRFIETARQQMKSAIASTAASLAGEEEAHS
ncbi:putative AMY-1-associating protein expressed in testis 1 [Monocercomonoides exilis]|uniref:putative AMY-1-associating protein expressed in testis 1 n=1 Tax=Monocercomonoides exilis TaxID=2049356 RepID=UPI0035595C28|nr:putative AMY-1-associating protein expressed in testis 1 [Monocercomonoides exilis]|eukprot:MONOS_5839.1-p1 / transcript=MONOS_5839.1 / gene=MONOS_5839 / organism=Monocercomonoides_exilis_PA203 / gene_product=AMY-1-associating protein expressed in testis 1 / transcript_product=AMY-1-associating protein expressed in testis 1 / location=Mono_scaffold00175:65661-68406(+) / protein_length=632 / sequence_SO=supercontig / SO=protein_coding / is_pseudo=false